MMLSPREKELHQAWLHYRKIDDVTKKMEVMVKIVHLLTNKEVKE